jgi:hypothetical protein
MVLLVKRRVFYPMNITLWSKFTCLLIVVIGLHTTSYAEQLTFNKTKKGADMHFSYSWLNHQDQSKDINFSLPLKTLNQKAHKKFIPKLAQQYVYIELHKAAREIDPRQARVKIQHRGQEIFVDVASRSDKWLQKWQKSMAVSKSKAFDQYLSDHYYSYFASHLGQKAIKPDHLRYIIENRDNLRPIAQAIYEQLPANTETRAYINLLLSWVQSIPYNPLQDRVTSNGSGYLPPTSVVANNIGDCDSKTVLMASLVRSLLPDAKMIMVYLPSHALLGMVLPFRTTEQTFEIDGLDYLLMEPTGPANMSLGEIAQSSGREISGNIYSYEQVL